MDTPQDGLSRLAAALVEKLITQVEEGDHHDRETARKLLNDQQFEIGHDNATSLGNALLDELPTTDPEDTDGVTKGLRAC